MESIGPIGRLVAPYEILLRFSKIGLYGYARRFIRVDVRQCRLEESNGGRKVAALHGELAELMRQAGRTRAELPHPLEDALAAFVILALFIDEAKVGQHPGEHHSKRHRLRCPDR